MPELVRCIRAEELLFRRNGRCEEAGTLRGGTAMLLAVVYLQSGLSSRRPDLALYSAMHNGGERDRSAAFQKRQPPTLIFCGVPVALPRRFISWLRESEKTMK